MGEAWGCQSCLMQGTGLVSKLLRIGMPKEGYMNDLERLERLVQQERRMVRQSELKVEAIEASMHRTEKSPWTTIRPGAAASRSKAGSMMSLEGATLFWEPAGNC